MDRRSWLWRRKSSEKSPGETESTGSLSSLSERFSDDQRSQSPELISKPVTREEEKATSDIKTLTERLSTALLNVSLKEDLAKQHAKVAEEAVAGWEKAEKEAAVLKQQLDASVSKVSSLEDQNSHLDSALKECVRQLWQVREEQSQKIQEAVNKKCSELESQIKELQARLETGKQEVATTASAHLKLKALEKENSDLKLQLLSKSEEVELRTIERDLSTQAAESASKQQLEGVKKLTKLQAECRKLRVMVPRSVSSNELKSSKDEVQSPSEKAIGKTSMASSVYIGLMDDFLEMEKIAAMPHSEPGRQDSESKPDVQSNQLKQELERSVYKVSELEEKVEMVEVDKVQLEMALNGTRDQMEALQIKLMETEEKLSKLKKLEPKTQDLELSLDESGKQIHDLQKQLNKEQVNLSELETIRAEKLELTTCLNGTKKQLKQTERKLTELQTLLRLVKDAKEAAEDSVKAANVKAEAVESRLRDVEAEAESLILRIVTLEESRENERALSAKHISKCEELQEEISELKHELGYHQEPEHEPNHVKAFDDDYKLKQEKELAVAASKFEECQRTIASLGQRLQSLATLERFLD